MTDTPPDPVRIPPPPPAPRGMGVAGKVALWVIAALILVPIVAVVGTYLSIFFIGYNR